MLMSAPSHYGIRDALGIEFFGRAAKPRSDGRASELSRACPYHRTQGRRNIDVAKKRTARAEKEEAIPQWRYLWPRPPLTKQAILATMIKLGVPWPAAPGRISGGKHISIFRERLAGGSPCSSRRAWLRMPGRRLALNRVVCAMVRRIAFCTTGSTRVGASTFSSSRVAR